MKIYPISVSMTPAFYDEQHMLLRTQLRCLADQTVKDFDVWLFDPHYKKRKDIIPELAERFRLDIKHVPYTPAVHVAKIYDCAIFNAGYCYSPAPTNVRYSCYRFARPKFIEAVASAPAGVNVDFHMLAVGPDIYEELHDAPHTRHLDVWNFESEFVNWNAIPTRSGYDSAYNPTGDHSTGLAHWGPESDEDTGVIPVPGSLFGNIAWRREQWLAINGTSEVVTNSHHWEDLDFDCRAGLAGQKVVRRSHLLYRLYHTYGKYSHRSNVPVDTPFKKPCAACWVMMRGHKGEDAFIEAFLKRAASGDLTIYEEQSAVVCKECGLSGALFGPEKIESHFKRVREKRLIRAAILPKERIGRNLLRLVEKLDKCDSLAGKVEIYNDSWTNPVYYEA